MGVFDTLEIECPNCFRIIEDQVKPGSMNYYKFGDDPKTDMLFEGLHYCGGCNKSFLIEMETLPKMIIKEYLNE